MNHDAKEKGEKMADPEKMFQCQGPSSCGYIYNPDRGDRKRKIPRGTDFQDVPEDWTCPSCGIPKVKFKPLAGQGSVVEEQRKTED